MKVFSLALACLLLICLAPTWGGVELGDVFLVLLTEEEISRHTGPFVLEDNYCFDAQLPHEQHSCRVRLLSPRNGTYSESRIAEMSLDFQHPSRPNASCHLRWTYEEDVRIWCQISSAGSEEVPKFRSETAEGGNVSFNDLIVSERKCYHDIRNVTYYGDGLSGYLEYEFPEQRPTVVLRTVSQGCVAGIVSGYRVNNYRTTEAPCVYNRRRLCRPLREDQYNALIKDIEASDTYADFRTSSERPHLRP